MPKSGVPRLKGHYICNSLMFLGYPPRTHILNHYAKLLFRGLGLITQLSAF